MAKSVYVLQDSEKSCEEIKRAIGEDEEIVVKETFTDGITALAAVLQDKPDYLITGLVIAGYDGISVTEKIKEAKIKTKVIAVTELADEEAIGKAVRAGIDYYIAKPVNGETLKKRIKELGERKEPLKRKDKIKRTALEWKRRSMSIIIDILLDIMEYVFWRNWLILHGKDDND